MLHGTTTGFFSNCLPTVAEEAEGDKQNGWRYKLVSGAFTFKCVPHNIVPSMISTATMSASCT